MSILTAFTDGLPQSHQVEALPLANRQKMGGKIKRK